MLPQKRNQNTFPLQIFKADAFENVILSKQIQLLADAAYAVAISALWNGELLSLDAIQTIKQFIKAYLIKAEDRQFAYTVLIERILLARAYVIAEEGRYIPAPSVWLNERNIQGFERTKKWWKQLNETRSSFPLHHHDMKVMAEAVVDMLQTPTAKNFHYWRTYFIERDWHAQLNLFLAMVANMQLYKPSTDH
jgi:hypothetical protein